MFSSRKKKYIIECVIILVYLCVLVFFHFHPTYIASYDTLKYSFLYLLLVIFLFNLYKHYKSLSAECQSTFLVVVAVTFLSSIPLLFKGLNHTGHDLDFHIYRIEGIAHEIRLGHIPARIYSMWCSGYGYPAPIYYGDILLFFPALLRIYGVSATIAYKLFMLAVNLCTAAISAFSFRKIFDDRKLSYVLTIAFCLTPYRLTDLYVRHSVGEYCAMIFFPLVAWGFYNIYHSNKTSFKNMLYNASVLALGMTGIVYTHTLSIEMVSFTLLLFFLIMYKKSFKVTVLISLALSAVLTLFLSAGFLIPLTDYLTNAKTLSNAAISNGLNIQDDGISVAELFTFFAADPESHVQLSPGIFMFLVLTVAIYRIIYGKASKEVKCLSFTSILYLYMCTNVFPWKLISQINFLNLLTQVQFPWRYLGIACTTLTLLLGYLISQNSESNLSTIPGKAISYSGIVLSIFSALVFVSLFAFNPSLAEFEVGETYFPKGVREYVRIMPTDSGYCETDYEKYTGIAEGNYTSLDIIENNGLDMSMHITNGPSDTVITLPRANYPGYSITDDNNNSYKIFDSDNMTVAFTLPSGFDGNIYLKFISPWYWTTAAIVSVLAFSLTILYFISRLHTRHT